MRRYFPWMCLKNPSTSREKRTRISTTSPLSRSTDCQYPLILNLTYIYCKVFHHIRREKHVEILKMLRSKLRKGGLLFIFELNPLNPLTMLVAIRNDYRFDKDAKLLNPLYSKKILRKAGFFEKEIRYTIFFPQFLSFLTPLKNSSQTSVGSTLLLYSEIVM